MAASAPAPDAASWTDDLQSSDEGVDTKSVELGMSGMSLVSATQQHGRKETGSTIASSPPDDRGELRQVRPLPGAAVLAPMTGSAPTSPQAPSKGLSRPPGLAPIGLPGHSKNSSATSPLLTLTPNSSVDGNSDWHSLGRQSSPFHGDGPAIPFLNAEKNRSVQIQGDDASGGGSYVSYELGEGDNDGLLGLEALRDRAYSSPGPISHHYSSSPPARGYFPAHGNADHGQDRQRIRDRPPLSGVSYETGAHHGDRSGGSIGPPFVPREATMNSLEASDARGWGAIARPELRQSASEYDPSRRRASTDEFQPQHFVQPQVGMDRAVFEQQVFSQKFGSLPTLGSHVQQQRPAQYIQHEPYHELTKPRHVRSVSQPFAGPNVQQYPPPGISPESRFYASQNAHSFSGEAGYRPSTAQRSGSSSHVFLSTSYEAAQHKSTPNMGGHQNYGGVASHQPLQRRDALDFHVSPGSQSSGATGPILASADEMRNFGPVSTGSGGQSPHHVFYGGSHSRQASDGSNLSMGSELRGPGIQMHRRQSSSDEDLSHPLVGEHIEVPADHEAFRGSFLGNPMAHRHSASLDQMPQNQFVEASHHLPTAGAALPLPKVVYSVKFKRSQRNFVLGPRISRDLKVGTYVKVEADRGEDLGIVVGRVAADNYSFSSRSSFTAGMGPPPGAAGVADLKRIMRLATHDEVSLLSLKRDEEEELLKICRGKVRQRGLPMHVVDAEYQFDRHKLTFFFEAEGRVDFRELVRDLFSMYKTRIWMQQLDKNTSMTAQAMLVPQNTNLQMDFGTPIIAPTSEFADSIVLNGMTGGDARSN